MKQTVFLSLALMCAGIMFGQQGKTASGKSQPKNGEVWNPDGIEMVYVQGTGSGVDAQKGFYIGKYEVTQEQWEAVMGDNPSYFKDCDGCPVEQVSWNDVQEFIEELNAKTGRNYRLPTEVEWEYAAKEGSRKSTYEYSGSNNIDAVAWYKANSNKKPHKVGTKKPNALGIYDMSGNVLEWCADKCRWDERKEDFVLDKNGSWRVLRGGSWSNFTSDCSVGYRHGGKPDSRSRDVGFRLARSSK